MEETRVQATVVKSAMTKEHRPGPQGRNEYGQQSGLLSAPALQIGLVFDATHLSETVPEKFNSSIEPSLIAEVNY